MRIRSAVTVLVTVAATSFTLAVAAPAASASTACPSTDPLPSYTTGSVSTTTPQRWWTLSTPTPKIITLTEASGDADLQVRSATCASIVCYPYTTGTPEVCEVPAGTYNVGALYYSGANGTATFSIRVTSPACSDGLDNDKDGKVDYPADTGCADAADKSEGVPCEIVSGSVVCAGISTGARREQVAVVYPWVSQTDEHPVVGYLRDYRFDTPAVVTVPCVDLVVDGATTSPCAAAGGVAASAGEPIISYSVADYSVEWRSLVLARLCDAEVVATVNGRGLNSLDVVTLC